MVQDEATIALEKLAAELGARGFECKLIASGRRAPHLAVRNPRAKMLNESVLARGAWFWWPWADKIALTADLCGAADKITRVLAATAEVD
jgi:hypothetical protein